MGRAEDRAVAVLRKFGIEQPPIPVEDIADRVECANSAQQF